MSESDAQSFVSEDTDSVFEDSKRDFLNLQNVEEENQENEVTEEDKASSLNDVSVLPMSQIENTLEKIIDKRLGHLLENQKINRKRKSEPQTDKPAKKIIYETVSSSSSSSESDSDTEDEEDIFVDEKEVLGKKIRQSSAKFVSDRIKRKIRKECLSKILKKYKTPKNAKFLRAQKTNKEIWRHASKTHDNFLTQIQNNVSNRQ